MIKERDMVLKRIMIGFDALVISLVFFMTFILRQYFHLIYKLDIFPAVQVFKPPVLNVSDYLVIYFFIVPLWCVVLSANGMYRSMHIKSLPREVWAVLKSAFWVALIFSALVFTFKLEFVSRLFFSVFMGFVTAALLIEKTLIFFFVRRDLISGFNNKRLLIVGTGSRAVRLMETIKAHPEWRYDIVQVVDYDQCPIRPEAGITGCEIVSKPEDMRRILHTLQIDEVIFVVPRNRLDIVEQHLYVCEEEGVDTAIAADFFNIRVSQLRHTDLDGLPLVTLERSFDKEWQFFLKRTLDVVVSGLGLVLLSPLFLIVALFIKLTSPGPVFFKQKRVSLRGRTFTMYKFRSMHVKAEEELKQLKSLNEVEGPIFKIKNDPRITKVGRFLRKFSIDELPQLYNVFLGFMSLVGPRPALPDEVEQYEPWQRRRLSMRPGITCSWQVYHRGDGNFKRWMESDLDYIEHWSLVLDFEILMKTFLAVFIGRGAY